MGLTVGIGASGWFWRDDSDAEWEEFVRSIVATGCTTLVRDLRVDSSSDLSADTPIYEARRNDAGEVEGRYLEADERAPIVAALKKTYDEWDSWAGFSWDHLEEVGAFDVQTLNVLMDVEDTWDFQVEVHGERHRIAHIERSAANYGANDDQCRIALELHAVAANHRLIIKSI